MNSEKEKYRLHVVDALRGFAIVAIMLLHNLEHFDLYFLPPGLPGWMIGLDKIIWDSLFFLSAGKAYAIFALLFGLTFFIQSDNQAKKGKDFRTVFAWRLLLLFIFGMINSAFFQGDILTIYAALGFFLIPVAKLNDKVVFAIAIFLFLQPLELMHLVEAIQKPEMKIHDPKSWMYFGKMNEYIKNDSIINTMTGNLTNGKMAIMNWSFENGRFLHILSLFLFGMLAGRRKIFVSTANSKKNWGKALIISSLVFIPLFLVQKNSSALLHNELVLRSFTTIVKSWSNLAFMMVLVSAFVFLFQTKTFRRMLNVFSPIGRMSLSNYIAQSIIGSFVYYGFGLGLYKYTGATYSLLIGISLAVLLGYACSWWAKRHKHGPLEGIWHKATWMWSKQEVAELVAHKS